MKLAWAENQSQQALTNMKIVLAIALLLQFCGTLYGTQCNPGDIKYTDTRNELRSIEVTVPVKSSSENWKLVLEFDSPVKNVRVPGYQSRRNKNQRNEFHISPRQRVKKRFPGPGGSVKVTAEVAFHTEDNQGPSIRKLSVPGYSCGVYAVSDTPQQDSGNTCVLYSCRGSDCDRITTVESKWAVGLTAYLDIPVSQLITDGWELKVFFDKEITGFQIWDATLKSMRDSNQAVLLINKSWNRQVQVGNLRLKFLVNKKPGDLKISGVQFQSAKCSSPVTPSSTPTDITSTIQPGTKVPARTPEVTTIKVTKPPITTSYPKTQNPNVACPHQSDFQKVLRLSNMFYEAQRSGKLPTDMRVKWRKDSAVNDATDPELGKRIDLEGGYYDAGDYVKFGFPMAAAITNLAWGMLIFEEGYKLANEHAHGLETIKWATDYFIKCHPSKFVFYGQVGIGSVDHAYWGRPEEMTMQRPAYKITDKKPGSELAAETATAMAIASLLFRKNKQIAYANTLLQHAKDLYEFATTYQRSYHLSITDAANFYKSWSGYEDELAVAAIWLYKATNDKSYLTTITRSYRTNTPSEYSWDNKFAAIPILLYSATKQQKYADDVMKFCSGIIKNARRTPGGLVWLSRWGSNRHAANVAFLCLVAAKEGINAKEYHTFARDQILFMLGKLGKGGRSYVVGFGNNPPQRPHHRSSSCPDAPAPCGNSEQYSTKPNPQVLYGALVGGPDVNGNYEDKRTDYVKNEVACDYNAGFQSALAGLIAMGAEGTC